MLCTIVIINIFHQDSFFVLFSLEGGVKNQDSSIDNDCKE